MEGHWGLDICKRCLNDPSIPDRTIREFIRQCPCCQAMSQLRIPIITRRFTCASYYPFEVIHLDHIGPLPADEHGNKFILVLIDAFSTWVELFPSKTTNTLESASCMIHHFGCFGTPEVVHTDRGTAFHNELIAGLLRVAGTKQSLTTAYSKEESNAPTRKCYDISTHYCFMHVFMTSGRTSNYPWCSVL